MTNAARTVLSAALLLFPLPSAAGISHKRTGFLAGAARADLVAIVRLERLPDLKARPQPLDASVIEVIAGEETRTRLRIWCGVGSEQQPCAGLAGSEQWVVSLVRAQNGPPSDRGYFLQFDSESVLRADGFVVTGKLTDDDLDRNEERTVRIPDLLEMLECVPHSLACRTTR